MFYIQLRFEYNDLLIFSLKKSKKHNERPFGGHSFLCNSMHNAETCRLYLLVEINMRRFSMSAPLLFFFILLLRFALLYLNQKRAWRFGVVIHIEPRNNISIFGHGFRQRYGNNNTFRVTDIMIL